MFITICRSIFSYTLLFLFIANNKSKCEFHCFFSYRNNLLVMRLCNNGNFSYGLECEITMKAFITTKSFKKLKA